MENCDLVHQFKEAERLAAQLSKDRTSLTTQLEDAESRSFEAKRLAGAETWERINLLGEMRNLRHELEVMKEHLDEECEAKLEVERQLSKVSTAIQLWKTRPRLLADSPRPRTQSPPSGRRLPTWRSPRPGPRPSLMT